jgi:hypothetical protein
MTEDSDQDFDLKTFINLIDTALYSDNPTVKRALRNLLMVATISDAEDYDKLTAVGPLQALFGELDQMKRRISELENQINGPFSKATFESYQTKNFRYDSSAIKNMWI